MNMNVTTKKYSSCVSMQVDTLNEEYGPPPGDHTPRYSINRVRYEREEAYQRGRIHAREEFLPVIKTSEWIKWEGGACPVDGDVYVSVKFRNGSVIKSTRAGPMDWFHVDKHPRFDIIAYKLA